MAFRPCRLLLRNAVSLNNRYSICSEPATSHTAFLFRQKPRSGRRGCSHLPSELKTFAKCFLCLPVASGSGWSRAFKDQRELCFHQGAQYDFSKSGAELANGSFCILHPLGKKVKRVHYQLGWLILIDKGVTGLLLPSGERNINEAQGVFLILHSVNWRQAPG